MDHCCENKRDELAALRSRQGRVLHLVLFINLAMFLTEFISGWLARSTALLGDSLDMLGDASVYAVTLFALHGSARSRAGIALFKGATMAGFGAVVIAAAVHRSMLGVVPQVGWMGTVGLMALAANVVCFALLYRHRADDLNMSSTWLCSRNDIVANTALLIGAGLVALTGTPWPDVIVGAAIALLFLHSARAVIVEAWRDWRRAAIENGETLLRNHPVTATTWPGRRRAERRA